MDIQFALGFEPVLGQLGPVAWTDAKLVSAVIGGLLAAASLGVRYRYSTQHALLYIVTTIILAVSPLTTKVFGIDPWFFFVGGGVGQAGAVGFDYLYRVLAGDPTGVEAFRTVAADWISRLRDRRRTVRRRIEAILDRKTIIAVLVGMPLSELMKATGIQLLAAERIQWELAWAHIVLIILGLVIGVHWKRVKEAAESAGDKAEELVEGEGTE